MGWTGLSQSLEFRCGLRQPVVHLAWGRVEVRVDAFGLSRRGGLGSATVRVAYLAHFAGTPTHLG
jgi:hypothetical protein